VKEREGVSWMNGGLHERVGNKGREHRARKGNEDVVGWGVEEDRPARPPPRPGGFYTRSDDRPQAANLHSRFPHGDDAFDERREDCA
jgi:hypothetical protein